jgi:hypothetical protein
MIALDNFLKDNSKWLLILLFSAGMFYSEMQDFKTVETRLSKKIKIIDENKDKIHKLELRIVALETQKCK